MRYFVILFAMVMVGFVSGCKKSNAKGGGGGTTGGNVGGLAIAGNEYQGFMTELSREWQKPILVHFNADSTVIDYSFFYLAVIRGAAVTGIVPNQTDVTFEYFQYSNRVYFYGYDEEFSVGVPYWGIISNDGNTINADTEDFSIARVPTYVQTDDYYGDAGNPPVMHKRLN